MTTVDDIILKQQETMPEKLDTIIDNLKERTSSDDNENNANDENGKNENSESDSSDTQSPDKLINDEVESIRETRPEKREKKEKREKEREQEADSSSDNADGETGEPSGKSNSESASKEKASEESEKESESSVDEYGEPIAKRGTGKSDDIKKETKEVADEEKIYTSSDVNRMIRERMERMKVPEAQRAEMQEKISSQVENFEADPNQEGDWLTQLKQVIKEEITAEKNQEITAQRERVYQQQLEEDQKIQKEFENKFTEGIAKRPDFQKVAAKMPITNTMMLGIREFKDPAGFIYAAAKRKPDELKKIAGMRDPLAQAAALGKLEASLTIEAKKNSKAPPIIKRNKGDTSKDQIPQRTVDNIIAKEESRVRR